MVDVSLNNEEVARLYEQYGYFLLRRCRAILRDPVLADDALHDVFVKVMRGGTAVRDIEQPLRWLYRIVDRCCFDALKRRRRSPEVLAPDEGAGESPFPQIALRDAVLRLLGTLDEEQMRIAVLLFIDGMSQGEIAEEVGVSRVTVNKRVQLIRARADALLEERS